MKENQKRNRPDVTEEAFNQAVEQLIAENKPITIRNVRDLIGGANETISLFIREYQRKIMMASFKDKIPLFFQEDVIRAAVKLYEDLEAKINEDRRALQDQYDERHREISELLGEADQKLAEAEERAKKAESEAQELRSENKQLRERIDQLTDDLSRQNQEQWQSAVQTTALLSELKAMMTKQLPAVGAAKEKERK